MGKVVKWYCDSCGTEIININDSYELIINNGSNVCVRQAIICNKCFQDIREWFTLQSIDSGNSTTKEKK